MELARMLARYPMHIATINIQSLAIRRTRICFDALVVRCTLVCLAAMIALSHVQAQTLTEKWSIPIPTDMSSLTINMQGTRYAYLIGNGTFIVRGNALTGLVEDTIAAPNALQVEYANDVLYCYYKDTADVYRFLFLADDSDTLGFVPLAVPAKQTSVNSSIYSRISTPTLHMLGRLRAMEIEVRQEDRDYDLFTSDYSYGYRVVRDSLLTGIEVSGNTATVTSADGLQVFRVDREYTSHRVGGGDDFYEQRFKFSEYYVDSITFNHRFTLSDPYASPFLPVQCSGILGIAVHKGAVKDYRRGVVLYSDTNLARSVGNLWAGGYQLVAEPWTNRLYCFNIAARKQEVILQSDSNRLVSSMTFHSRQASSLVFAVNRKRDELIAYHISVPPPNDRVELTRDHDTIRMGGVVRCYATLYAEAGGCMYNWYVNDSLWNTTSKPEALLRFQTAGVYRLKVTVVRDSSVLVASDTNDGDLVVLPVSGFDFSVRVSNGPVLDISVNDQGTHLGCSLQDTVALLRTAPHLREIESVLRIPYMGGIGFIDSDTVITSSTYRREDGGYDLPTSFAVRSLAGDSIGSLPMQMLPRSLHSYYVNDQIRTDFHRTALSSALIVNKNTNMYYWFTRYAPDWPLNSQRGHLLKLKIGDTSTFRPREFGGPCRFTSTPTGACMTFATKVFLVDLPEYRITDSISAPKGSSFTASVHVDSDVVLTNLGEYQRESGWQSITPQSFPGTMALFQMSNPNYYIAVVQTVSASAHVIARSTGEVVHTFPSAFHYSTAAAYDSVYRMLYIGDSTGYITAWSVPQEFAVNVGEQPHELITRELMLTPNPAGSSVRLVVPENESVVSCSAVSTLGTIELIKVTTMHNTCNADISSLLPGMYILVLNTTHGTLTAKLMVVRP